MVGGRCTRPLQGSRPRGDAAGLEDDLFRRLLVEPFLSFRDESEVADDTTSALLVAVLVNSKSMPLPPPVTKTSIHLTGESPTRPKSLIIVAIVLYI